MPRKAKGSFWPEVRRRMREKAVELFMAEHSRNPYFTGQTPEMEELREGGYFYQAKLIVLRNLWREKKGLPSVEEEAAMHSFV